MDEFNGPNNVHFVLTPGKEFEPDINSNMNKIIKSKRISNIYGILDGKPVKFKGPEDILEEFCKIRYRLYKKRKENLLRKWTKEYKKDQNRFKFITEVIDKTLKIFNRDESDLFLEMKSKEYEEDSGSKEPFGYLVNMSMRSMTKQKLDSLNKSIESWRSKIESLKKKSEGDLWNEDLDEFLKAYNTFLRTRDDGGKKKKKITKLN